jgi:prepilin-type N-terminal cleavage/methylation domain-containing protein
VRREKSGLTLIEMLVVLGIIALVAGIFVPVASKLRNTTVLPVKQQAQFTAIELGLDAFRSDYGDYPPSNWWSPVEGGLQNYCGAQKLAEALVGYDLLGFHPGSTWQAGLAANQPPAVYAAADTLKKRRDRYVDLDAGNAVPLGGLFVDSLPLAPYTYVLCDVFEVHGRTVPLPGGASVVPGTPILYYRANLASKTIDATDPTLDPRDPLRQLIYNVRDNAPLVGLGRLADGDKPLAQRQVHPLDFYNYIRDPKVAARAWPYRPDSYLLISAGADGLYGTNDDIRNFGRR